MVELTVERLAPLRRALPGEHSALAGMALAIGRLAIGEPEADNP
jgi:hypothetical protein